MQGDTNASKSPARDPAKCEPGYAERAFEQYRMYVGDIGRLERLRGHTNTFYLSINTGLIAALVALAGLAAPGDPGGLLLIASGFAGLIFARKWGRVLQSYAALAKAKWGIVIEVEKTLPLRLYQAEWDKLKSGPRKPSYTELTAAEKQIPPVFMTIYLIFIAYVAYFLITAIIHM